MDCNALATRTSQCEKKLARLLFDFCVVNTTDDDCEQQVPTVCSVDNNRGLTPSRTEGRINIWT